MALPIALGGFIQFVVVFTDNFFLSQVDKNMMNGAGNSGLMYVSLLMIIMGLASGMQIIVARRNGENKKTEAGKIFANSLLIGLFSAILIFFTLQYTRINWLDGWVKSESVLNYMDLFLNLRSYGVLFYFITLMIVAFYSGIAKTKILIYTTIITAGFNIFLDYVLIFGNYGIPPMGVEGAAMATLIAEGATTLFALGYIALDKFVLPYKIGEALKKIPLSDSFPILKISFPLIIQFSLSLGTWTVFFLLVEKLGENQLQISHIVRNLYMLVFASAMGFGQTTKTYISSLIAEKRQNELIPTIKRLIFLNLIGILILSHGFWLYPEIVLNWFSIDPSIMDDAKKTLLVVMGSALLISISTIVINTILASGRTIVGLLIEIAAVALYLIMAYYYTVVVEAPIYIVWISDILYFFIVIVLAIAYLKWSNWKYHEV